MNCKNCGNKLIEGSKYCPICGQKVTKMVQEDPNKTMATSSKGLAIASLVIGIVSIFFGSFFMVLPIVGLILGLSYKEKCGEKTAGIILNSIGIVISILALIASMFFGIIMASGVFDRLIDFDGISFSIQENWEEYSSYVDYNNLDNSQNIEGFWKELSDSNGYLIFGDGEYYFYKDMNNREEEYVTGSYRVQSYEELFGRYRSFGKLFEKLISNMDEVDIKILTIDSKTTYKNGVVVLDEELEDDEKNIFAFICNHDGVVELVLDEFMDDEMHFYKIKE